MADRWTAVAMVPLNFKCPTFCHFLHKSVCYNVRVFDRRRIRGFHGNLGSERAPSSCFSTVKGNEEKRFLTVCVCVCVFAQLCEKDQMAGWGSEEGGNKAGCG